MSPKKQKEQTKKVLHKNKKARKQKNKFTLVGFHKKPYFFY